MRSKTYGKILGVVGGVAFAVVAYAIAIGIGLAIGWSPMAVVMLVTGMIGFGLIGYVLGREG